MEFRLIYEGKLKSNADKNFKHELRMHFNKQLKELWLQPPLSDYSSFLDENPKPDGLSIIDRIGIHKFAPLVSSKNKLICELEITMLQPKV